MSETADRLANLGRCIAIAVSYLVVRDYHACVSTYEEFVERVVEPCWRRL